MGKWIMYVDFTNLNSTYLKDGYLLPRINTLVDSKIGYPIMSFLDAFLGFHQIKMHPKDYEKIIVDLTFSWGNLNLKI